MEEHDRMMTPQGLCDNEDRVWFSDMIVTEKVLMFLVA